ncbi:MAG: amidohydrolase family protein [Planctomycetia bacterium]|nr:amidohydrolase family protein [Planctomycetia bacterium]
MARERLSRGDLAGKTIDVHSHAGVSLKAYGLMEYPYAQTVEGLYYQQKSGGVDVNVVFPLTCDLYFELGALMRGDMVPAAEPISAAPFAIENRTIMSSVFNRCPELSERFLPFVSIDPGRAIPEQLKELEKLGEEFPIYGIKVNATLCQSRAIELLGQGGALLDFAEEQNLPMLFHATTFPDDQYSQASDVFRIAESRPALRICIAHCLLFHRASLDRAASMPNVWVDTAAIKIQVELVGTDAGRTMPVSELIEGDYSDHTGMMLRVCERFPETIVWGSDSPCYSYICDRKQGAGGEVKEFRLKGTYEDEIAALNCLPPHLKEKVSSLNTLDFIFGRADADSP